jgi:RNA polymerase sigma-54 factor
MNLSQRLDIRQTQSLVMTPQLQQAIKLLQMSSQELSAFIAQEIEKNPLLERAEDADSTPSAESMALNTFVAPGPESYPTAGARAPGNALAEAVAQIAEIKEAITQDEGWESGAYGHEEGHTSGSASLSSGMSAADNVAVGLSLREHLLSQIHVDFPDPAQRLVAAALVEFLDEAGYLPVDLDLARAQLGATPELFEQTIAQLQRLDPPGIFARSLQECLTIQLREKNRFDPAMQILLQHLDLVAKRERAALMKLCGVDAEDLGEMLDEIRALNPRPATAFTADVAQPVTPDVFLYAQSGGGWRVELNGDNLPRVIANEMYYTHVRAATRAKPDKDYLSERWQQANWLVKALHQRATTILKVAAEIVRQQDQFFVHGVQALRPLILRDIATAVEMHESTVSRVTQNKYIATPRGMFELKYFFSAAIGTTGGAESVSALAVRDRIKDLIGGESPQAILSDDKLTEILRAEGIDIARRTVAKYREALRIPSSSQRRREKIGS